MSKIIDKIKIVMLSVMIASVLIATTIPVLGYDQNNPATYTVKYIIPSSTTFAVTLCGSQTEMDFNATNGSSKLVEPNCQIKANDTPWANITNQGNLNLNFSTNVTTTYSWVEQYIASNSTMADQIMITNASLSPNGWLNVAPGATVQLYSTANFTNAPFGTNSTALNIYSHS